MKKSIVLIAVISSSFLLSCGPAAEDREKMHARAKVFQDSIADFIRQSLAEAEAPAGNVIVVDTAAARKNAEAAAAAQK
jgi:hypothetical protein